MREMLAEQPPEQPGTGSKREQLRSFDPLASVDMLRFDLQRFGQVLPETRQRVYDEELSSIAEAIDRASRTEFVLAKEGDDLVYFDRGQWRSYTGMLITGNQVAHEEARQDSRRKFLAEWSDRDLQIGYQLRSLQPGQVLTWTNGYPHEQEERFGAKFMQDRGLKPKRKMGFVYRAEALDDGSVVLESQTLDGSDASGLAAIEAASVANSTATTDELVTAYDIAIRRTSGRETYAGRTNAERFENVWIELAAHKDLMEGLLGGLEAIAGQNAPRDQLRHQTEKHIVGAWKALKLRLDKTSTSRLAPHRSDRFDGSVQAEIDNGYELAFAEGDMMIRCGGSSSANKGSDLGPFDLKATFDSIFGNPATGESRSSWKWKDGVCRVEACPTRPGKTKVGPCAVCVRCQAKFDAGHDPTKATVVRKETKARPTYDLHAELAKIWNKALKTDAKPSAFELVA